jgi:hypothetical protein
MNLIDVLFFLAESKLQANIAPPITQFKMADIYNTWHYRPVQVKDKDHCDKWH